MSTLENVILQIAGIKRLYSISGYNGGEISVTFDKDVDLDFKKFELSATIRNVYNNLPKGLSYPVISQSTGNSQQNNFPILIFNIIS